MRQCSAELEIVLVFMIELHVCMLGALSGNGYESEFWPGLLRA